jgi:glucose/arabinose dehydrogenase
MLVSRGSDNNVDTDAAEIANGHSQIKAFDLTKVGANPYDFVTQGTVIGWGLRNSVGIAEHPVTGGLFSVENSVDNIIRNGVDFHQNDPGDEMNFHGFLNGSTAGVQGGNYGYPNCVTAWSVSDIPDGADLTTGSPMAYGALSNINSDAICANTTIPPRLTFQAHWAPIDIVFNTNGTVGYVTSHGSQDRMQPIGYLLLAIPWDSESGQPIAPENSQDSYVPVMSNQDDANCPDGCFRPTGLVFDARGRLYMTSDVTGEIYIITTDSGGSVDAVNGTYGLGDGGSGGSNSSGSSSNSSSPHQGAATHAVASGAHGLLAFALALLAALLLL